MSISTNFNEIKISSRILELMILFFAVFIGFVVDNYRDEYSEKKNSKELLKSLKIDLEKDVIRFDEFTKLREILIQNVYLFIDDIDERGLLNNDLKQQSLFANAIFSWTYFNPNVANIEQVIGSGALRYLGNDILKNQIGVIESLSLGINDRQEREQEFFLNYLQPLMHKYYNFKWLNKTYVRRWVKNENSMEEFRRALKNIKRVNPSGKDLMLWDNDIKKKKELINLFENYVFILRSSYVTSFDTYLNELNNTIELIEDNLEENNKN